MGDWHTNNEISRCTSGAFVRPLNLLILMVSVSMVWPGLLAALLIVYCINMRKTKNYSSDFDDDNRVFPLLLTWGVHRFPPLFLVMFLFHMLFSWYIFIMSTLPHFPVNCMDSHLRLFSLPWLSCLVSYHREKITCKMFIKTLKSISSYVPHRRLTVVFALVFLPSKYASNHNSTAHLRLSLLFCSLSHSTWHCQQLFILFPPLSFAVACTVALINPHRLKEMHPIQKTPHFLCIPPLFPFLHQEKRG